MSNNEVEHNQCDICLKKFQTAIGFHRHYPNCVDKHAHCTHVFRLYKAYSKYEIQICTKCELKKKFDY